MALVTLTWVRSLALPCLGKQVGLHAGINNHSKTNLFKLSVFLHYGTVTLPCKELLETFNDFFFCFLNIAFAVSVIIIFFAALHTPLRCYKDDDDDEI